MKLVKKMSIAAILMFFSIGAAGILILLHGCADPHLLFTPSLWFKDPHAAIPLAVFGILVFSAAVMIIWLNYFHRHVVRTLRQAEDFVSTILAGNMPDPLSCDRLRDDELISLFSTLNFMRDRQQNLSERLNWRIRSEEELRHEIEYFDDLQLAVFNRLLPEMRRSAGIINAYTRTGLAAAEQSGSSIDPEMSQDLMQRSLKRQARFFRELDYLSDVVKLERKRWNNPVEEEFSTQNLARELTEQCRNSMQTRDLHLTCTYQAGTPEHVNCDREVLYQLLYLLISSLTRSLDSGSKVELAVSGSSRTAVFEIRDNREDPHREYIAEKFNQISCRDEKFSAFSNCSLSIIGLEIVRHIADKIGCTLEVDSNSKSPTILKISVPARNFPTGRSDASELLLLRKQDRLQSADSGKKSLLNIMLSDDDREEADIFQKLLQFHNVRLTVVGDNATLLKTLESAETPDGIMIAAPFGTEKPAEFIRKIRNIAGNRRLPVVILSPVSAGDELQELNTLPCIWSPTPPLSFPHLVQLFRRNAQE